MKFDKLLIKLVQGNYKNISFKEFQYLIEKYGFKLDRVSGSHHIYTYPGIPDIINIQNIKGEAKPYQIKQVLKIIEKYNLEL